MHIALRKIPAQLPNLGVSSLLTRIYATRGITSADELNLTLSKLLPYQDLSGITDAVNLLISSMQNNDKIIVIGDFDVDGATSCATAVLGLRMLGAKNVQYLVPNRFKFGYGLTTDIVSFALKLNPNLLLTVDNGITSIDGVVAAKKANLKVIITDHHLPGSVLPQADAIINPNQNNCRFASKNLAGVGVMFYLLIALRAKLRDLGKFADKNIPNLAKLLDLVALGTVADMVQLDFNNRILVHQGLARIRTGIGNIGINALIEVAKLDNKQINANHLSYQLAPRLNAAGRMDDMRLGVECLLADDVTTAVALAHKLTNLNSERKTVETAMQLEAHTELQKINFSDIPAGICLYQEHWHQGVSGILATKITNQYLKPTIIFAKTSDHELKGSGRSIDGVHLKDCLTAIANKHPNLILSFGGHSMAAGLTIYANNFAKFAKEFAGEIQNSSNNIIAHAKAYDFISDDEINLKSAFDVHYAGTWGTGFLEPMFYGRFTIIDQYLLVGKHLKLKLITKSKVLLDAVSFNVDVNLWPNRRAKEIEITYRLNINRYNNLDNLQLIIEHLAVTVEY